MSRSSPGVRRVAAILNFIADHPGQAFALTDLVRALRLSRATCHALLTGLVDVGYLYRTSDKSYVLGPALAAIGRVAVDNFSPLQVAQPEMRALADEFDVLCGAYFLEDDVVHLRDRAASVSHVGYPIPLGNRHALRPTQAPAFFINAPDAALAWFARRYPEASAGEREQFAGALRFTDANGFTVVIRKAGPGADLNVTDIIAQDSWGLPVEALSQVDEATSYALAAIFAPVRELGGRVSFSLGLVGFSPPVSGKRVMEAGLKLRASCDRISGFVSGRPVQLDEDDGEDSADA